MSGDPEFEAFTKALHEYWTEKGVREDCEICGEKAGWDVSINEKESGADRLIHRLLLSPPDEHGDYGATSVVVLSCKNCGHLRAMSVRREDVG